jgi:hypothetical protein
MHIRAPGEEVNSNYSAFTACQDTVLGGIEDWMWKRAVRGGK